MNNFTEIMEEFELAYPGLSRTQFFVLSSFATIALDRKLPFASILIGQPSAGKTTCLLPLMKCSKGSELESSILRVDDFSPASLISHYHSESEKKDKKRDLDLLPKMKNKCVVVKEMAPVFQAREDQFNAWVAKMVGILDGEGFVSASGTMGLKGINEKVVFTMIGAVANGAINSKVRKSMSIIGPRFCFWEVPSRSINYSEWEAPSPEQIERQERVKDKITNYCEDFIKRSKPASIDPKSIVIEVEQRKILNVTALLLCILRGHLERQEHDDFDSDPNTRLPVRSKENPERAVQYLTQLVQGASLIQHKNKVSTADCGLALEIALSSCSRQTDGKIIRQLLANPVPQTASNIELYVDLSRNTVDTVLKILKRDELVHEVQYDGTRQWALKPPFDVLYSRELLNSFKSAALGGELSDDSDKTTLKNKSFAPVSTKDLVWEE